MSKRSTWVLRWLWMAVFLASAASIAQAADVIPAAPTRYFNDYALQVSSGTADKLNRELEDFERQTSNQLVVVIFPKLQTDSDLADYCQRAYRAWGIGQKANSNGAVLFLFVQDHKSHIQTGKGLEGALPDATCEDILEDQVRPKLKAGDWDGGVTAGVNAMIAAAKGEYKGSGRTVYDAEHPQGNNTGTSTGGGLGIGAIIFLVILFFIISRFFRGGGRRRRRDVHRGWPRHLRQFAQRRLRRWGRRGLRRWGRRLASGGGDSGGFPPAAGAISAGAEPAAIGEPPGQFLLPMKTKTLRRATLDHARINGGDHRRPSSQTSGQIRVLRLPP